MKREIVRYCCTMILIAVIILTLVVHAVFVAADFNPTADFDEVNTTKPKITIIYDEPIRPESFKFAVLNSLEIDKAGLFTEPYFSPGHTEVYLNATADLEPGIYDLIILDVCDKVDNCADSYFTEFELILPALSIELVEPKFGIFSAERTDLTLKTNRDANCRFSTIDETYDLMGGKFISEGTPSVSHTYINFPYISDKVYFRCKDKFGEETSVDMTFSYDNTPPRINVEADDVFSLPIRSQLRVECTNKKVQCKYSKEKYEEFDQMTEFDGFNLDDKERYASIVNQNLLSYDLDEGKNTFYVQCISMAGITSLQEKVVIEVDPEKSLSIDVEKPDSYMGEESFKIEIYTSMPADCTYTVDDDSSENEFQESSDDPRELISKSKESFDEGEHVIYFECVDVAYNREPVEEDFDFVVDLTDPVIDSVVIVTPDNSPGYIIEKDTIELYFEGDDNLSGIDYYEYMIFEEQTYVKENITGWEYIYSDSNYKIKIPLEEGKRYYVKMRAFDMAGRSSEESESESVTYDPSKSGSSCTDNTKNGPETDVDCGGDCPKCEIGNGCKANEDCVTNYCNSELLCEESDCDDDVLNGDETDVDCGGSCSRCSLDKDCKVNDDCQSGNCVSKKCTSQPKSHCTNGVQDHDETGIDCGGAFCEACGVGQSCEFDADCVTNYCDSGICSSMTSDSDNDGIPDNLDNCIAKPNSGQEDFDNDGIGDECDSDIDGDGMLNDWELRHGLDPYNPDDANADNDGDGLSNSEEHNQGTDPNDKDSDTDGYSDYDEIYKYGTDPTVKESKPKSFVWFFIVSILFIIFGLLSGYYLYYEKNNFVSKSKQPKQPPKGMKPGAPGRTIAGKGGKGGKGMTMGPKGLPLKSTVPMSRAQQLQMQQRRSQLLRQQILSSQRKSMQKRSKPQQAGAGVQKKPASSFDALKSIAKPKSQVDKLSRIDSSKDNVRSILFRDKQKSLKKKESTLDKLRKMTKSEKNKKN